MERAGVYPLRMRPHAVRIPSISVRLYQCLLGFLHTHSWERDETTHAVAVGRRGCGGAAIPTNPAARAAARADAAGHRSAARDRADRASFGARRRAHLGDGRSVRGVD